MPRSGNLRFVYKGFLPCVYFITSLHFWTQPQKWNKKVTLLNRIDSNEIHFFFLVVFFLEYAIVKDFRDVYTCTWVVYCLINLSQITNVSCRSIFVKAIVNLRWYLWEDLNDHSPDKYSELYVRAVLKSLKLCTCRYSFGIITKTKYYNKCYYNANLLKSKCWI